MFLLAAGFMLYRYPTLFALVFDRNAYITLPLFPSIVFLLHMIYSYIENQEKQAIKKHAKIKDKLKDTKR